MLGSTVSAPRRRQKVLQSDGRKQSTFLAHHPPLRSFWYSAVKIQLLSRQAPVGSRVALLLISGEEITCNILEYGDGHILVDVGGRHRRLFDEAITGFEIVTSPERVTAVAGHKAVHPTPPEP